MQAKTVKPYHWFMPKAFFLWFCEPVTCDAYITCILWKLRCVVHNQYGTKKQRGRLRLVISLKILVRSVRGR